MYDYNIFLNILNQTKGLNNSLNQILKYDFIYHSNKIDGSNFTIETLQLLAEKKIVSGTHNLDDVYISFNSFIVMDLVLDCLNIPLTLERLIEWFKALIQRTKIGDSEIELYNREAEDELNELIKKYNSTDKQTIKNICKFHLEFNKIRYFKFYNSRISRFIFLKQLLENKLPLKYMNGESAKEYKKALQESTVDNIEPLISYLNKQKDFIEENIKMF
ncbi:cell filamentation protein Fic [Clostridium perfringens]|uniref:cell filamentation protein Fic n=1 Tax=Clostridium perfringens TaxID=1502 RepID=UPI002932373D|nr:cell filamentation protein Fic [Clostridium perfringens]ELP5182798.1 Fic family protein [Clostridium perfringens]ELP5185400.1 Fic family protein [Clostridium perfringens]MEA5272131.1 cell filamentation protein Fic [Clostridium perfringens]MEA5312204.1 cell filamentation protein Fic [Clostridium perfringens]MEA5342564.1 cell filamentation protein Fic [Clostridium perfringens]